MQSESDEAIWENVDKKIKLVMWYVKYSYPWESLESFELRMNKYIGRKKRKEVKKLAT